LQRLLLRTRRELSVQILYLFSFALYKGFLHGCKRSKIENDTSLKNEIKEVLVSVGGRIPAGR
jgi:hypothetical protein